MTKSPSLTSVEICAGAGGQALGLEQAGFDHRALVEIEKDFSNTLRLNRPHWNVINGDVQHFSGTTYAGVDLLAGGVPCPPFSKANQRGQGELFSRQIAPTGFFENIAGKWLTPKLFLEILIQAVQGGSYRHCAEFYSCF